MGDLTRIKAVAVYCASRSGNVQEIRDGAAALGTFLAEHGIRLVYGGSNIGLMRILADTVLANGGTATGVFMRKFSPNLVRTDLTESLFAETLAERKQLMLERVDAAVAMPGGLGTIDELFDAAALRWTKSAGHLKPVGLLNLNGYFDRLLDFLDQAHTCGFSKRDARHSFCVASTPAELFHQLAGSLPPLESAEPASPAGPAPEAR